MSRDILDALDHSVLVCEGEMATALASRSITLRNAAMANLTHPELVQEVHRGFLTAGAQVFLSNTVTAQPHVLAQGGLLREGPRMWAEGLRLCRQAVGEDAYVGAAVGPIGSLDEFGEDEARAAIRQQLEAMLSAEVDFVLLEASGSLPEAIVSAQAVRELDGALPVAVLLRFGREGQSASAPGDASAAARALRDAGVDIVGARAVAGGDLERAVGAMAQVSHRHLMACEDLEISAGGARNDYSVGQSVARLIQHGARLIRGGTGCGPDELRQMVKAAEATA